MRIGIYGFGSVGNAIYNELKEYKDLYVLVDKNRLNRYQNTTFTINGIKIHPTFTSSLAMDIIFICVKNYDLVDSLGGLVPFINKNTILIPMLNGITAHDVIKECYPYHRVLYGAINVEANKEGNHTICGRILNLQFGDEYNYPVRKDLMEIRRILSSYNINNNIYPNMKRRVWMKWMLNMGINQVSAILNATYKEMTNPYCIELFKNVFYEVYEVSKAYHIGLEEEDILDALSYFSRKTQSNRVTSLTLDVQNKRKSEMDDFGGALIELAKKKNIEVPVNESLYALLKMLEARNK